MYREDVFFCSTSRHGCVHTYCPYFGKTADCTTASASVHWPWFSKKNLQPQGLQIFFREPWPKYKSFGIVQSLVFPKLGQVLIVHKQSLIERPKPKDFSPRVVVCKILWFHYPRPQRIEKRKRWMQPIMQSIVSFKLHPLLLILFFYSSLFQPFHINPFHSTVVLGVQTRQNTRRAPLQH